MQLKPWRLSLAILMFAFGAMHDIAVATAEGPATGDYRLAPGDAIRIQVFQNPDLSLETRVSDNGNISYPLVGSVALGGDTIGAAEQRLANALREGGFVKAPQVNISLVQVRGNQVSVLGLINKPGRYPLEAANTRLSELIATAGGLAATGADIIVIVGIRDGKPFRREVDLPALYLDGRLDEDILLSGGDTLYVHRAPMFYIYGEVQRPGVFRVERKMTVQQALITGGGPSLRGTERGLRLHRRGADGKAEILIPAPTDSIFPDDVLFVRESLF